jgi:ADP-ribose pyrophosphatase YjhB (NUDIX family)
MERRGGTDEAAPVGGRKRQRVAVYGIAVDPAGRVLVVRAAQNLTVRGRWFLPGGGLEHGETPAGALGREVAEETGLEVLSRTLLGVLADRTTLPDGTDLHTVRIIYRIDGWAGSLRAEASGSSDAVRWVPGAELATLPVMPYVTEALSRFAPDGPGSGLSPRGPSGPASG